MITEQLRERYGIRHTGTMVSIVAAATPTSVYLLTTGRTCEIRKIMISNRNPANANIQIGMGLGAAFVQCIPQIFAVGSGQDLEITEEQIPNFEFTADITAQSSAAAAAPNDVQIQVEVEEYQGPNG